MARSPPKVSALPLPPPPSSPQDPAAAMMTVGLATLANLTLLLPAAGMDHQFSISISSGTFRLSKGS